jgi:hypothetical protein
MRLVYEMTLREHLAERISLASYEMHCRHKAHQLMQQINTSVVEVPIFERVFARVTITGMSKKKLSHSLAITKRMRKVLER